MTYKMKSMVLAACMAFAAGMISATASAEDQWGGLNPCEMGANPCYPDEQGGSGNPCEPHGGWAENPCAPQPGDSDYTDDPDAPQEPVPELQLQ